MLVAILISAPRPPMLEIAAVADTLCEANIQSGHEHYRTLLVAQDREPFITASGPMVLADATFEDTLDPIDTVVVIPGRDDPTRPTDAAVEWLRHTAPHARRVGSACTGAFGLGAAGLLEGRRVTTHWQWRKSSRSGTRRRSSSPTGSSCATGRCSAPPG